VLGAFARSFGGSFFMINALLAIIGALVAGLIFTVRKSRIANRDLQKANDANDLAELRAKMKAVATEVQDAEDRRRHARDEYDRLR
jgi:hypothetical protein